MLGHKGKVAIALIGILSCLSLFDGLKSFEQLSHFYQTIGLHFVDEGVGQEAFEKISKDIEQPVFTQVVGWEERDQVTIKVPDLERMVSVKVNYYRGDLNVLLPKGSAVSLTSREQIIMTEALAKKLWGDTNNIGQLVQIDREEYEVSAIIKGETPMAYCLAEDDAKLSYLYGVVSSQEALEQLSLQYTLPKHVVINRDLESRLTLNCLMALIGLVGIGSLIVILQIVLRPSEGRWYIGLIMSCLIFIIVLVITREMSPYLGLPQELLPNKWSDFEFYTKQFNQLTAAFRTAETMGKNMLDLIFSEVQLKCIVQILVSSIGLGGVLFCLRTKRLYYKVEDK